ACVLAAQTGLSRPPVLGLAHVRLMTSDMARARTFYGGLLGFPELAQSNGQVAIFRVNDRQHIIVRANLPPDRDDRFVDVAWETGDLDAARAYLAARPVGGGRGEEP